MIIISQAVSMDLENIINGQVTRGEGRVTNTIAGAGTIKGEIITMGVGMDTGMNIEPLCTTGLTTFQKTVRWGEGKLLSS